ncbi:MAG: UDP-N-acetylmuramyl-tripeptide synthetase [Patescibacteria group bacterium]|nr:UDP-N-acetylmuramyl-tripeptide synthetase [Patescibacteria group bacterium]
MSRLKKIFYNFPGLFSTYHFLWAWAGARLHGHPSGKIFVIGVTGTKGKTTTLELVNAVLEAAGKKTALLSSLREKIGDESRKNTAGNSMPGRGYIQKFLDRAVRAGCSYALVEVTSQGVVAHRHRFVDWNMGVFTNIHPEHIESHGSFENYRKAKLDFLKYVLKKGGMVFINRDDPSYAFMKLALEGRAMEFTKEDDWLKNYLPKLQTPVRSAAGSARKFWLSGFNEENIAVAAAIAHELGINDRIVEQGIMGFQGVPGRMEFVSAGGYTAIVDYAHTPESLEAAYGAARSVMEDRGQGASSKLICVLGAAGGGRDKWKRPEFGKIAAHYCDRIILTDEDPYDEDPEKILDEVEEGIKSVPYPRPEVLRILDRRKAIERAVWFMNEGDLVIGTGKGSEDWIHVAKGRKIPWSERRAFEDALLGKK